MRSVFRQSLAWRLLVLLPRVLPALTLLLLGSTSRPAAHFCSARAGGASGRKRRQQSLASPAPHPAEGPKTERPHPQENRPTPKEIDAMFLPASSGREEAEDRGFCTARASHNVRTRLRADSPPFPGRGTHPASRDRWRDGRALPTPAGFSTGCSEESGRCLA